MSQAKPSTWDGNDVLKWAKDVGADSQIVEALERHDIDGFALLNDLDIGTLKSELHIDSLGKRSKFVRLITEVKVGQTRGFPDQPNNSQAQPLSDAKSSKHGSTVRYSNSGVRRIYESIPFASRTEIRSCDDGQDTYQSHSKLRESANHKHYQRDNLGSSEAPAITSSASGSRSDVITNTGKLDKILELTGRLSAAEVPVSDRVDTGTPNAVKRSSSVVSPLQKDPKAKVKVTRQLINDVIDLTTTLCPKPKRQKQAFNSMARSGADSPTSAETSGEESLNFAVLDDDLKEQVQRLVNEQKAKALFVTIEMITDSLKRKLPIQINVPLKQKAAYRNIFIKYASAMLGRECQPNDLNAYELDELQKFPNFKQFHADWQMRLERTSFQSPTNVEVSDILPLNAKGNRQKESQLLKALLSSNGEHAKPIDALSQPSTKSTVEPSFSKKPKNSTPKPVAVMINPDHKGAHHSIYIDNQIALHLRPHQVEGIRFLWRELTLSPRLKGALLAHTMGLGKTLQIITFLLTLLEANASEYYRHQLPKHLQGQPVKILILMPPTLARNWVDEATKWVPRPKIKFFRFFSIPNVLLPHERLKLTKEWHSEGGVLTLGFAMFRLLIENEMTATNQIQNKEKEQFRYYLLSPTIVVADEAHALKNPKSSLGIYANSFKTTCRIALTGSPLSNNLLEYYHIVNWIDEGFLGSLRDFKAKYVVPIAEGLYSDSSPTEARLARRKLAVIKTLLSAKVHRRDIGVIKADLPNKTEFVLSISMSSLQRQLYQHFLNLSACEATQASAGLLSRIHILKLICSHPRVLQQSLENRTLIASAKNPQNRQETPMESAALKATVRNLQASDSLFDQDASSDGLDDDYEDINFSWARPILQSVKHCDAIENGLKFQISMRIIELTEKLKEKVLVFSHSLLVLNLIQSYIELANIPFQRLDGTTKMAARQGMTKSFNDTNATTVFLVSTRAGGLGINLQGANRVIILDTDFNPTHEQQAVGRAYRFGQQKHVMVYRFRVAGTYEEKLENQTLWKLHLFNTTIQDKKALKMAEKGLTQYFDPLPSESELYLTRDVPHSVYHGKDKVLESIMEEFGDKIYSIALTNTFEHDEDHFTEQETAEMDQELQQLRQSQTHSLG